MDPGTNCRAMVIAVDAGAVATPKKLSPVSQARRYVIQVLGPNGATETDVMKVSRRVCASATPDELINLGIEKPMWLDYDLALLWLVGDFIPIPGREEAFCLRVVVWPSTFRLQLVALSLKVESYVFFSARFGGLSLKVESVGV